MERRQTKSFGGRGGNKEGGRRESGGGGKSFGEGNGGGFRRGGAGASAMRQPRFTIPKGTEIDYKNIALLQKCLTERGKVFSRRLTSTNAKEQRQLTVSVKRARFLGLLPVGTSKRK